MRCIVTVCSQRFCECSTNQHMSYAALCKAHNEAITAGMSACNPSEEGVTPQTTQKRLSIHELSLVDFVPPRAHQLFTGWDFAERILEVAHEDEDFWVSEHSDALEEFFAPRIKFSPESDIWVPNLVT